MYTLSTELFFFCVVLVIYVMFLLVCPHWHHLMEKCWRIWIWGCSHLKHNRMYSYKVSYRCTHPNPQEAGQQPKTKSIVSKET